ncbi:sigma-70 family RNA polymerase sigma factor [Streptomyces sp. NPDC005918]|uniref:sigma-70 family RNA polymerase sigma factor n=1 Tax=Streptomyces sp. NPDC005918 TaxID=3155454 RepID=UPI00340E2D11
MKPQAIRKISPRGVPEPELVAAARTGDREAFATLYNDHRDAVFCYVRSRVHSQHLAEDMTQDVFVRALARVNTFTWQGRDFGAWLITIARNLHLDYVKSARTRREVSVGVMYDSDETDRSAETVALRKLEAVEAKAALHGAIYLLNPYQRECITRRFIDELTVEETAAAMGRKVGAVKTLQYRALRTLEHELRAAGAVAA